MAPLEGDLFSLRCSKLCDCFHVIKRLFCISYLILLTEHLQVEAEPARTVCEQELTTPTYSTLTFADPGLQVVTMKKHCFCRF